AVARQDAVGPAAGRLTPVGDVDAGETTHMAPDLLEHLWRVPQVPGVELHPERRMVGLVEQRSRLRERRDERPVLAADTVDRLEADAHSHALRLAGDRTQAFDDGVAVVTRPGETDDSARMKRSEAMN